MRAHDLAIAAFLAETIYNFGELVRTADRLPAGLPDVLMAGDCSSCTRFSMRLTTHPWHGSRSCSSHLMKATSASLRACHHCSRKRYVVHDLTNLCPYVLT